MQTFSLQPNGLSLDLVMITYLLVKINNLEIVQGIELSWIVVSILLSVKVDDTCIRKDAVLCRPLITLEDSVSTLPNEPDLYSYYR